MSKITAKIPIVLLVLLASACATVMKPAMKPVASCEPLIVLITDFGEKDHYTGAMKGAIYTVNPSARIDCITNQISKFDIAEGAFTLAQAAREYPPTTIFVAVVDPGVGSQRKGIAVKTRSGKIFIGPDNGLLWPAVEEAGVVEARELSNRRLWRKGRISNTFHGRDIFGPVAGHLAAGVPFEEVGPAISVMAKPPASGPLLQDGRLAGQVVHVDDYGNVLTNIPVGMLERLGVSLGSYASVMVGDKEVRARFVRTYSDVPEGFALLLDNLGFVETAVNKGSLAGITSAEPGMSVTIGRSMEAGPQD